MIRNIYNKTKKIRENISQNIFSIKKIIVSYPVKSFKIKDCMTMTGFSYDKNGWHHVVRLIEEIESIPDLRLKDSILYKFHQNFQPTDNSELIKHNNVNCNFIPPLGIFPWGSFPIKPPRSSKLVTQNWFNSNYFGPSSIEFLENRFETIKNLFISIKQHGYQRYLGQHPTTPHGLIGGNILRRKDGSEKFIVQQGNHRLAVLCYLGFKEVTVGYVQGHRKVVNEEEINNWKYVKNDKCTIDEAQLYFNAFFELSGKELAGRFNLI